VSTVLGALQPRLLATGFEGTDERTLHATPRKKVSYLDQKRTFCAHSGPLHPQAQRLHKLASLSPLKGACPIRHSLVQTA
jgi:hypothetical protein